MSNAVWAYVAVPDYSLASPAAYAADTTYGSSATYSLSSGTGSSFLQIGAFPNVDDLDADDNPSGFANSVALVQLIGRLESIDETNYGKPDQHSDGKWGGYDTDDTTTSLGAHGVFHDNPRAGDTDYSLVGFIDDTRRRPDSLDFNGTSKAEQQYVDNSTEEDNTTENRQEETRRLLYKGGWWDHTDGNRIVTTGGDKIENHPG
ncbi:MAG: hypothetical protein QM820_21345 [Minicystis sp.]